MARRHHRFTVDRKTRQIRTVIDVVNHFLKATALALVLVLGTLGSAAATAGSVDLPKYQRSGAYDLPIGSGANLLADEASAVTYNWDTKTLFVVGDGGTSITQLSLTGALIDSMTLAADASKPQGTYFYDPEGLAYVGNGQFVLGEERTRQLHLLTYTAGTTHGAAGTQTVKLGTTIGNIGRRLGAAGRGGTAPCGPLRRPRPRTHFCSRFARSIHPLKVVIMFKKFALALAVAAALPASALTTGDLAFTAFNADEDGFALVALANVAANTKVYFSDNEWSGTAFNTGENFSSWTSGAAIVNAGTVIRFSKTDSATLMAASVGTLARETVALSTNWGLSQTADTVYAYLGMSAAAPTTFLSAISSGTFGNAADGTLANTGLAIGAGAVQLSASSDFAEYSGARAGQTSFVGYKALVSNVANWTDSGDGSFATKVPNTTAFTISAVPEPESYALMLAGPGAIGLLVSRRRA